VPGLQKARELSQSSCELSSFEVGPLGSVSEVQTAGLIKWWTSDKVAEAQRKAVWRHCQNFIIAKYLRLKVLSRAQWVSFDYERNQSRISVTDSMRNRTPVYLVASPFPLRGVPLSRALQSREERCFFGPAGRLHCMILYPLAVTAAAYIGLFVACTICYFLLRFAVEH
jgi:hypothetical protein